MTKKTIYLVFVLLISTLVVSLLSLPSLAATIDPVFAQTCEGTSRDDPVACAGTYPGACGTTGDRLSCSDGITESFETQNDFAAVEISSFDTSITDCSTITQVEICYEWWRDFTQNVGSCQIAVDANGGTSFNTATTSCPGTTTNPGVTCVDVTSLDSWTCESFFGTTGTRAHALAQASKTQGQGGPGNILFDALYFVVEYEEADTEPPTITVTSPEDDGWSLTSTTTFTYIPNDNVAVDSCSLYIDAVLEQTDDTVVEDEENIFEQSLNDGVYDWRVECSDTSNNTNTSETRTVRVDTTGPVVNLETPEDEFVSVENEVTFFYNALDEQTTLASCSLLIDDSAVVTTNNPPEETTLNFTWNLVNDVYGWSIRCTDDNGFVNISEERIITIDSPTPILSRDQTTYFLGETVHISGGNFEPEEQVTIEYTLANNTILTESEMASSTGSFTSTLDIGYDYPRGAYDVFAYTTNNPSINASTSFTVELPPTVIETTPATLSQGDAITITGTSYPINDPLTIVLTFSDSSIESLNTLTNSTGGFTTTYNVSYTAALGSTDVFGNSEEYPHINASTTITVLERIATLSTDKQTYEREEDVTIEGLMFTRNNQATLTISDDTDDATASGFPTNKTTNNEGSFTHTWNTANTCNGLYRVDAQSTTNSQLTDTIFFEIEDFNIFEEEAFITSGITSEGDLIDPEVVGASNDEYATIELGGGSGPTVFFEFDFDNSINPSLEIEEVVWTIEHSETTGFGNPELLVWDGSGYVPVSCPDLSTSTTDVTQNCDITSSFADVEALNEASLRFQLDKTAGGGQEARVDFTSLNATVRYEPSCQYLNGTSGGGLAANPPVVEEIIFDDQFSEPEGELDLIAGANTTINCNSTISDGDGFEDIEEVSAKIFHESVSHSSENNPLNHYTNSSCELITGLGLEAEYSCTFQVAYYAQPGEWTCRVDAQDEEDTAVGTTTATMNELYALDVSPTTIDYGTFELGQVSDEQSLAILNLGNSPINISVYGYANTPGDDLAMICDANNIPINAQRYSTTSTLFNDKQPLSSTLININQLIAPQTTTSTSQETTYWQLEAPASSNPQGACQGTLFLEASP